MDIHEKRKVFKEKMLDRSSLSVLCGAFDGITARAAKAADYFDGCYMGGQATAASILGVPDIGLVTGSEQIKHAMDLAACVDMPFVIDADTGYGNELNVRRTQHCLETAGIYGAHYEDQITPKRCGGMKGVQIETCDIFARKISAAVKAREDEGFIIIARSDACEVEGEQEAIHRMNVAADCGADMAFLFSAKGIFETLDDIHEACEKIKLPVLYCLMEFCPEVCHSVEDLKEAGVSSIIWPNGLLMRWCRVATDLIEEFKRSGKCRDFYDQLMPIQECNKLLGIEEWNPPGMFEDK